MSKTFGGQHTTSTGDPTLAAGVNLLTVEKPHNGSMELI